MSVDSIKELLQKLGHEFDWFYGESDVVKETELVIKQAKLKKKIVDDNGALLSKVNDPVLLNQMDHIYI